MKQHNIGWILLAIFAAFLFLVLLRKKQPSSVTHQIVYKWDSTVDPPPSFTVAPPLQLADGTLTCAQGYSLWQDSKTGNYACYRDPLTVGSGDQPAGGQLFKGTYFPYNPFASAQLTDSQGNPIPGGT